MNTDKFAVSTPEEEVEFKIMEKNMGKPQSFSEFSEMLSDKEQIAHLEDKCQALFAENQKLKRELSDLQK